MNQNYSLTQKAKTLVISGLAAIALSFSQGCTIPPHEVPNHLRGHKIVTRSGEEYPHTLEPIVLYEKAYNVQKGLNLEDSVNVVLYPLETTTRILKEDKTVDLTSQTKYVPFTVKDENGKAATNVSLRIDGNYGIKADTKNPDLKGIHLGTLKLDGVNFRIKTIKLNDGRKLTEYYAPIVEETNISIDGNALNNYLIEKQKTEIHINQATGEIKLRAPGRIYRPLKIAIDSSGKVIIEKTKTEAEVKAENEQIPTQSSGIEFE